MREFRAFSRSGAGKVKGRIGEFTVDFRGVSQRCLEIVHEYLLRDGCVALR